MTRFREEAPKARPRGRRLRPRLLVVTAKTEKRYLDGLRSALRNPAVDCRVLAEGTSPWDAVHASVKLRDRAPDDYDEVWVAVDRDDFARAPKQAESNLARAIAYAQASEVRLAVTTPCFELFLVLHFQDHTAPGRTERDLERLLKRHVPGYDKGTLRFADFAEGVADACRRAWSLDGSGSVDPSAQIVRLVARFGPEFRQ